MNPAALSEVADGATLFLDEIGDMALDVQSQFLKVIEEKKYRRLGDVRERKSDFRLIAATSRNLVEETSRGRFRSDLFFRINVFPLVVPPLRQRLEDLPGLIHYFLLSFQTPHHDVSDEVMSILKAYSWPGNVRELKNVIERAVLLAHGAPLTTDHFPGLKFPARIEVTQEIARLEYDHIRSMIARAGGDMTDAAEMLGISRATLYRKIKKFGK